MTDRAVAVAVNRGKVLVMLRHKNGDDCCVLPGGRVVEGPLLLGGPEALSQSETNRYTPEWVPLHGLGSHNLQPETLRALPGEVQ